MSDRCPELHELVALRAAAPHDPRRAHLEACPRCRAALASFVEFVEPREIPAGADVPDAERRLGAALARARAADAAPGPALEGGALARLARALAAPALRPAVAAAALVVVAVATWSLVRERGVTEPVMRAAPAAPAPAAAPVLRGARVLDDGRIEFAWSAVPGAEGYELRVLDASLVERVTLGPVAETTLVVDRALLTGGAPGALYAWRVRAVAGGGALAQSAVGALRLP